VNKLLNLVLLVALLSINLGMAAVPASAGYTLPEVQNSANGLSQREATKTRPLYSVWPIILKNNARWNSDLTYVDNSTGANLSYGPSVELSVLPEQPAAEVEVLLHQTTMGDIDFFNPDQVHFYGYALPSDNSETAAAYLTLYCDATLNGVSDYMVKFDMVAAEGEEWQKYVIGDHWQVITDNGTYDFNSENENDVDDIFDNYTGDLVLGAAVSASVNNLAVDALTLGQKTYNLGTIQQAINTAEAGGVVIVYPGKYHDADQADYKYDEFLVIDKALSVKSWAEYEGLSGEEAINPIIQPASIPMANDESSAYTQIVRISASDVSLAGFTLENNLELGDNNPNLGIIAVKSTESANLSNVTIQKNSLFIDEGIEALGIAVVNYGDEVLVSHNTLHFENLTASATGIQIYGSDNVTLTGNTIDMVNCADSFGIYNVKNNNEVISQNILDIVSHGNGTAGVMIDNSSRAAVNANTITISTDFSSEDYCWIEGVYFDTVDMIQTNLNTIKLTSAAYNTEIEGIGIWNEFWNTSDLTFFERAQVNGNQITVDFSNPQPEVNSELLIEKIANVNLYGIWVANGERLTALKNSVAITANCVGMAYIEGLNAYKVNTETSIGGNRVSIEGSVVGIASQPATSSTERGHFATISSETAKHDVLGMADLDLGAAAEAYGIKTEYSDNSGIEKNSINVNLYVFNSLVVGEDNITPDNSTVLSLGVGLETWDSESPQITGNAVVVMSETLCALKGTENVPVLQGNGVTAGLGIFTALTSGAVIYNNSVIAQAYGRGGVSEVMPVEVDNLVVDSIQSTILNHLNSAVTEAAGAAGAVELHQPQADLSIENLALMGVIGVGILAYSSPSVQIVQNDPVIGVVKGLASAYSRTYQVADSSLAAGALLGLGGGILLIDCAQSGVLDNGLGLDNITVHDLAAQPLLVKHGVTGFAQTLVSVSLADRMLVASDTAAGVNAGISFGILSLSISNLLSTAAVPDTNITGNRIVSAGQSSTSLFSSSNFDNTNSEGINIALRLGIAVLAGTATLQDNTVYVDDSSYIDSQSETNNGPGEDTDSGSIGANIGLALGIVTYCNQATVLDNTVETYIYNTVQTSALDDADDYTEDATALSGDLTLGVALLVIGGDNQILRGNKCSASSVADTTVEAACGTALDLTSLTGLVVNLSAGLALLEAQNTVATENTWKADTSTYVYLGASSSYIDFAIIGIHLEFDVLTYGGTTSLNYNDVGSTESQIESQTYSSYVLAQECGLYNLDGKVNARYNYWNDPTGPGGLGQGYGAKIINSSSNEVPYSWWLSHPVADLLKDNVGYYGFSQTLEAGWNTLSVPMALEYSRWSDIVAMSNLDYSIALYYDPTQEYPWQQVMEDDLSTVDNDSYVVKPLNGMYVKMNKKGTIFFTTSGTPSVPESKLTRGQSWYLVGPTPYDGNYPFTTSTYVENALVSIIRTPEGIKNLDLVISPSVGGQKPWAFPYNYNDDEMELFRAYWVFVESPDTLAGYIFTPMPVKLPIAPHNDAQED
jgi:hypothetical protein